MHWSLDPLDPNRSLRIGGGEGWAGLIHPTTKVGRYAVGGSTEDEMWDRVYKVFESVRAEGLACLQVDTTNTHGEPLRRTLTQKIGPITHTQDQFYCYVEFCRRDDLGEVLCTRS